MYQYYIIEIQQHANGEYGHLVHWAADADPDKARMKAESKYHEVLSAAAISNLPMHSAALLAADGFQVMHQCYRHEAQPAAEEE